MIEAAERSWHLGIAKMIGGIPGRNAACKPQAKSEVCRIPSNFFA